MKILGRRRIIVAFPDGNQGTIKRATEINLNSEGGGEKEKAREGFRFSLQLVVITILCMFGM